MTIRRAKREFFLACIEIQFYNFCTCHRYVLTTVLEEPFLSLSQSTYGDQNVNDKYEGYVKDLATLIAQDIGVSFEIRPAMDGKYGTPDKSQRGENYLCIRS